jgi:hypothetical protein
VSSNEDKKSKEKEQSEEVNSPEIAEENNTKNDKGNICIRNFTECNRFYTRKIITRLNVYYRSFKGC